MSLTAGHIRAKLSVEVPASIRAILSPPRNMGPTEASSTASASSATASQALAEFTLRELRRLLPESSFNWQLRRNSNQQAGWNSSGLLSFKKYPLPNVSRANGFPGKNEVSHYTT